MWHLVRSVLGSFCVKQLRISWDTGSGMANGFLIGLQHLSSHPAVTINVNWANERNMVLELENKAGRIAWAVIRVYLLKK
jgi:hypothetical protein